MKPSTQQRVGKKEITFIPEHYVTQSGRMFSIVCNHPYPICTSKKLKNMVSLNEEKGISVDISEFKKPMHEIQKKLIIANNRGLLVGKGYRAIGKIIGIAHPQQIKHHLTQLKKYNLI